MAGGDRARQPDTPLLRWIVGTAIGLVALHGILFALWGGGEFVAVLPWYLPTMHGFAALAGLGVAFLAFGRYAVLREPAPFWIGMAFGAFAILFLFQILAAPGLLPGDRGLISQLGNAPAWLGNLAFSALAIFLPVAVFARWPRVGARGERWWPWLAAAGTVIVTLIGWLSVFFEGYLPLLIVGRTFTPLYDGWFSGLIAAYAGGAALSTRRYRQTGDSLLGYTAIVQLVMVFFTITTLIGGERWDTWWYWRRILLAVGFSMMLFGLLSEYVGLYRRERERTRELEALQRVTQEERNRLRVLIETAPIGIALHSAPYARLMLFNRAVETIMGRPLAPELAMSEQPAYYGVYRPDGELFSPKELPVSRALRGETCLGIEMLIRQPSGHEVHVLANCAPLHDAEGRIKGGIVTIQDITPIRDQERLRDEFLSTAAHELKTPVTTIKGYAQMMRLWAPEGHEPREKQAIEVINAQADRISRRVQEMLEVARYRVAPPAPHRVRFDLGELAQEVVQRMQATTQIHRLVLQRQMAAPVEADRERIEEVLVSLLDNAIRYSPPRGEIEVRVRAEEGSAIASVQDHGVGIPMERQGHIFEPFYEAVPPGAPGYRSVAPLSLYLSELTIDRHEGRIWFESEEGKGSTFYFSLPLAKGGGDGRRR